MATARASHDASSRLVEREAELAQLRDALTAAAAGRGSALLIEGAPGIGKTALMGIAVAFAREAGLAVLEARGGELEHELAFSVVRQLFEPVIADDADPDSNPNFAGAARLAAGPLGLRAEPASDAAALHGLYWLCANVADRGATLLAIDDLHWTDEPSLRFLSYLSRRSADHPLMICAASRPEGEERTRLRAAIDEGWGAVLRPQPLSEAGVAAVVRGELADSADAEFCSACARASGGNPFLLVETLAALRADGVSPTAAESERLESLRPDSLAKALLARIARLGAAASAIAQVTAVLGADTSLRRVAALADITPEAAATAIEGLRREAILAPGDGAQFAHPLVRNAVYADIAEPGRGLAHLRAARLLEAEGDTGERITPHLLAAEPASDPWVVKTLRAAAGDALSRAAPEPAVALLERAVREPPTEAERAPILLDLGRALARAGQLEAATEALKSSLELTRDPVARAAVATDLGAVLRLGDRTPEGIETLTAAVEGLDGEHDDMRFLLETEIALASHMGPPVGAEAWVGRLGAVVAESMGASSPSARTARGFYAYAAAVSATLPAAEVAALAESAVAATDEGDPPMALQGMAAGLALSGKLGAALSLVDQAVDAARELGDASQWSFALLSRSWMALRAGRILEAEADARACLAVVAEGPANTPYVVGSLMLALIERDDLDGAEALMEEHGLAGIEEAASMPDYTFFNVRGRLRRLRGSLPGALEDLERTRKLVQIAGLDSPAFAEWRLDAVEARLGLGEVEVARGLAAEGLAIARDWGAPRETAMALRAAGLAEGGERGVEQLRESVDAAGRSEARLELARSRADLGAALRRAGRRKEAQEELRRALDLASELGALRIANAAREELTAAGARPRRERTSGPESLTASEMRVARMAADGLSNPAIAQALFVTRRTVEVHLTNTYRKLEISSREELPTALASNEPI